MYGRKKRIKEAFFPLNADVLEHCRTGKDQIKHCWLPLSPLTLSLQCNLVHQTGWNTLHLPFSPQSRDISDPLAASVDDTDVDLLSPIPKQKHQLKHNIIKAKMELDHKKKQSNTEEWILLLWGNICNPLLPLVQQSPTRASKASVTFRSFNSTSETSDSLMETKSYPCFQHIQDCLHSSPQNSFQKRQSWPDNREAALPTLCSVLLPCFIVVLQLLSPRSSQVHEYSFWMIRCLVIQSFTALHTITLCKAHTFHQKAFCWLFPLLTSWAFNKSFWTEAIKLMFFSCQDGNLVTVQFVHLFNDANISLSGWSVRWLQQGREGAVPRVNCFGEFQVPLPWPPPWDGIVWGETGIISS